MLGMFFSGRVGNDYVVQLDEREVQALADLINEALKGLYGILMYSKRPKGVTMAVFGMSDSTMEIW